MRHHAPRPVRTREYRKFRESDDGGKDSTGAKRERSVKRVSMAELCVVWVRGCASEGIVNNTFVFVSTALYIYFCQSLWSVFEFCIESESIDRRTTMWGASGSIGAEKIIPWVPTHNLPCDHSWKRTLRSTHGTANAAITLTWLGHAGLYGATYLYLTSIKQIKRGAYLHDTRQRCNRNVQLARLLNRTLQRQQICMCSCWLQGWYRIFFFQNEWWTQKTI